MTTTPNPLESLEFFDMFSGEDPIDSPSYDPNQNIAPDILNGNPNPPADSLDDDLEDSDDDADTAAPNNSSAAAPASTVPDDDSDDTDDDSDSDDSSNNALEDDEDDDDINYFEVFGNGLLKAGILEAEDGEEIEWTEETFLNRMSETVEKKAWDTLEMLAAETYGEAGVKLVEDLFINKAPIQQYLQMFNNEQIVENVDLTSAENQERVIRLYLAKTGMDEDSIEDQLTFMTNNDKLETYSKKYHGKLIEKMQEEREALSAASAAREQQRLDAERQRSESYASVLQNSIKAGEINGYPINERSANELYSFVLDKPHQLPNGQRISDFEYKLAKMRQEEPQKFLAVARLVQADLDLTPVKRKGVSEETNSIFNDLKTKTKKSTKSSKSSEDLFSRYFK